jgi:hypothetical protein
MEQVVNNIIKWYQAENSKVKYLILYTSDGIPKRKVNKLETTKGYNNPRSTTINMDEIDSIGNFPRV